MNPRDLGLPEKFSSWRDGQLKSVSLIASAEEYCFLLDAPTGSGKSLTAAAVQKLTERKAVYVCTTKQLQDQLMGDFPYAKTVKGRGNYVCLRFKKAFPTISAEHCTHTKKAPCDHLDDCPYMVAKLAAMRAPLAVLNTAYFLSEVNYAGGFSETDILVLDEADTIEDQLMNFIQLVITQKQLDRLGIPPPQYKTKFESWIAWAEPTLKHVTHEHDILAAQLENTTEWGTIDFQDLRREKELKILKSKLSFFIREVDKNWVWYPAEDKWTFKPVWVAKYARIALWQYAQKTLAMSATILDPIQMDKNVGITTGGMKYQYHALPSMFPKEHRPVFFEPCANLTYKTMGEELPKLAIALNRILAQHPNEKILCHTVSYRVKEFLMDNLKPKSRLMTHASADRANKLLEFKASKGPMVLLSPSMDRGVDLPEDECRVVVIAKLPWPDLGDPQVQKRVYASKDGNNWYSHRAVGSIIQMSGRACRSQSDHSVTYILDSQFERLYSSHRALFPDWWTDALIT